MSVVGGALFKRVAWAPLNVVRPLSGVSLVVPFYHVVSDKHVPHVSNLYRFRSISEFQADLEFFARNFLPVSLSDIVDALEGNAKLPRACFHLTFDDGFTECYEVIAPMLEKFGLPATFFLNTAFLDGGGLAHYNAISVLLDQKELSAPSTALEVKVAALLPAANSNARSLRDRVGALGYADAGLVKKIADLIDFNFEAYVRERRPHLSSEQVSSLYRRGFAIGAHSHTHPLYRELPLAEQIEQTRTSIEWLVSRFGVHPRAFAFPHNDDGVGKEFFSAVFSERLIDVSFGTSGLIPHFHPRNIQRVSMEKTPAPARNIIARQFLRATYRRFHKAS